MNWRYRAYQRAKLVIAPLRRGRILSFDIHRPGMGFFAHLNWCAEISFYCQQRGLRAQMSCTSPDYRDPGRSANWLSYFFELFHGTPHIDFRIAELSELCIPEKFFAGETIEEIGELVRRNLPIKQEIAEKVDRFCDAHFRGKKILGVHFRGTDKAVEAPRVSEEAMRQTVANYLSANNDVDALFVASDERTFQGYMRDSFPDIPIIHSQSDVDVHFQVDLGSGNYRKGEEALIDCLLLSRCGAVVRTASFLSAWASIFNPKLPIVMVNRPYDHSLWFPDRELIARSMDQYLPPAGREERSFA
jgi:Nodulation protein Z (NodZ)